MKMKLWMMVLMMFTAIAEAAAAGPQWYQDVYGTTNFNGQVTLHDVNGTAVTAASNPTGANVSSTQSSSLQPPVVIVQATTTLPIHAVGDACTATTSGTSPNQTDGEGIAITLDRTSLLTCQSGLWSAQQNNMGGYLFNITGYTQRFYGAGYYNSGAGTFSGTVICDPRTYGSSCGMGGFFYYATNSPAQVWSAAGFTFGTSWGAIVGTSALPVNTITQQW